MSIISALKNKFGRKSHPAQQPYVKSPPQNTMETHQNLNSDTYAEVEADLHNIAGTSILFGKKKSVCVDSNNSAKDITEEHSYVIGSGKLVSSPEQISGICSYCEQEAMKNFQAGNIVIEQAQLQSLFDIGSAASCQICGLNTCSRHCRPINVDDQIIHACVQCQKDLKPKFRLLKMVGFFLISPLLDNTDSQKD